MRGVIIAILGTALAGCAPKPLPDWAVIGPAEGAAVVRIKAPRTLERQAPDRGPPSHGMSSTAPEPEILPFTPAWQAREDAHDRRLRRSMHICGNC